LKKTFKGGIIIDEHKNTEGFAIDRAFSPTRVIIPMSQHIGAPCTCTVKKGDLVKKGQLIGAAADGLSCPVHASVSGTVTDICDIIAANGKKTVNVIIENDGLNTPSETVIPKNYKEMTPQEIIDAVRTAGISGLGGATFPTYAKLLSALSKVDTLIVNCSECEPYITANHRLMLEEPERLFEGVRILLHALGLKNAVFGISDNKPDAIKLIKELTKGDDTFKVEVLKTKYPQGDERQLIYAVTKRRVPVGKLPADVGCIVFNPETVAAVESAVSKGMPLTEKIVTVDGDCIENPKCVKVPIGTEYKPLLEYCGCRVSSPRQIISGGTMMGFTVWTLETSVQKGCSSILVFENESMKIGPEGACIRCGKCVAACPMRLMPSYIAQYAKKDMLDECEKLGARACVECGSCSYVCPAKIHLSQYVRTTKAKILAKTRRMK